MTKEQFFKEWILDVKIKIHNREECYEFQRIAFEFGVKVHSEMNLPIEQQTPIHYNIGDVMPEYKGKTYATDMENLVIKDNGKKLQKTAFYWLENDNKEIKFDDFINAYKSIENE